LSRTSPTGRSRWRGTRITGSLGGPILDSIENTIIANRSTAFLAFVAGKFDMTFPYEVSIPLVEEMRHQAPQAICDVKPTNGRANLLVTNARPFDDPVLRRVMQLTLDRPSSASPVRANTTSALSCSPLRKASGACLERCWSS
jgi:ABC-type oligopeptide transport system substrate-binding subunit